MGRLLLMLVHSSGRGGLVSYRGSAGRTVPTPLLPMLKVCSMTRLVLVLQGVLGCLCWWWFKADDRIGDRMMKGQSGVRAAVACFLSLSLAHRPLLTPISSVCCCCWLLRMYRVSVMSTDSVLPSLNPPPPSSKVGPSRSSRRPR